VFNDDLFDDWLGKKSKEIILKLGDSKPLTSDEMIILVLKAQTNHFSHLDHDLREEMGQINKELREEMIALRKDMDMRFEQVDKRFEQVDKRFESLALRMDRFMIWSFATTVSVGAMVVAAIKLLP